MSENTQLTVEEFSAIWRDILGHGWKGVVAKAVGVSAGTMTRWLKEDELPPYMQTITSLATQLTRNGVPLPEEFSRERE